MPIFEFKGCHELKYDGFNVPRQAIVFGGKTVICFARFDPDRVLQLVQFCKRGRMNGPESGITTKCCSDYEEVEHCIEVPAEELNSGPHNFGELKEDKNG